MASYDFDLLTIGAGSGGVAGSRRAASYGARVGIIESTRVGGTCVLRGCVPKKLLIYGVHLHDELEDAAGYGWSIGENTLDWGKLIEAKDRELDRLNGIYLGMLERAGVKVIEGRGRLIDAHTVAVGEQTFTSERIMIATGGWPLVPEVPGAEHAITSNEALDLKTLPRRIVIWGGGYIAVEFAGIFRAAGCDVHLVVRADRVLRGFDGEVRDHLTEAMKARGINIHGESTITRIEKTQGGLVAHLDSGIMIDCDQVMAATGRAPNTAGLGLAELGIETDAYGAIVVDEWSATTLPNIYAVGDVTNHLNLTPVAIGEARGLAETLYNNNPVHLDHATVPSAVFSQPPVATVGMTEEHAALKFGTLDIYTARFRPLKATLSGRSERVLMKLVVDAKTDRVLGCHMVGPDAPEIIQGMAIAVKLGATKKQFDATVGIHPTSAEEFVTMREKRVDPIGTKAG
jgi:glutathione reductase (NADPH)